MLRLTVLTRLVPLTRQFQEISFEEISSILNRPGFRGGQLV